MLSKTARMIVGFLAVCVVLLVLAAALTAHLHRGEVQDVPDAQKLARTVSIIRSSTPQHKQVLKVLFYGQSITRSGWEDAVIEHWHTVYPNTVFVTQNRALGGFDSTALLRPAPQDLAAFNPDLIVFHVYGSHRSYEQIVRLFRSLTAADIILQSDHGNTLPEPYCVEGLRHTLHRPEGCIGRVWLRQRMWNDEMSYHHIPAIAKKYNAAVEPQHTWYRNYFLQTHVDPRSLTIDGLHPNDRGKALLAYFFNQYFDSVIAQGSVERTSRAVQSISPANGDVAFDGTRLELLTNAPLTSWPAITIDGTPTAETDGCYLVSRASSVDIVPDWPATRSITLHHDHTVEDWTAVITNTSADDSAFQFSVHGSVTGDDGSGNAAHDFVSRSGKLELDAQDWEPAHAFSLKHVPLKTPFTVHWSVSNQCSGKSEIIDMGDGQTQYRYTLVTGAANAHHVMHWQVTPQFLANVIEFRAYQPPLR